METFAEKFQDWKDFPRGLSVLLVDQDTQVLSDIKSKLESYHYIVTAFSNGDQALSALTNQQNLFHVALVEATANDGMDGYKILEASRRLPTIVMSAMENMTTMMKFIALGAVEFLQKPLSEEKLKNIWQHVVRKALDSGDPLLLEFLEPVKASSETRGQGSQKRSPNESSMPSEEAKPGMLHDECASGSTPVTESHSLRVSVVCERFSAPTTPQLEQGGRMASKEDTLDESPSSVASTHAQSDKERIVDKSALYDPPLKVKSEPEDAFSVMKFIEEDTDQHLLETKEPIRCADMRFEYGTCNKLDLDNSQNVLPMNGESTYDGDSQRIETASSFETDSSCFSRFDAAVTVEVGMQSLQCIEGHDHELGGKETILHTDVPKAKAEEGVDAESPAPPQSCRENGEEGKDDNKRIRNCLEQAGKGSKSSSGKKKIKVDWTPDLHRRFVQAVELLGVDQAIPSRILEVMNVGGLTRHNIASHLQKYRSHRKHLHTREVEAGNRHHNRPADPSTWARLGQDGHPKLASHQSNSTWIQPRLPILPSIQTYPTAHGQPIRPPLHVWGHPTVEHPAMHMWQQYSLAPQSTWQAPDGSLWQHPAACVDGWVNSAASPGTACYGQPMKFTVGPPGLSHLATPVFPTGGLMNTKDAEDLGIGVADGTDCSKFIDFHPPKELLDAAISEALTNPWTPLPLGLKPPSMESVMVELQRQGINTVPLVHDIL